MYPPKTLRDAIDEAPDNLAVDALFDSPALKPRVWVDHNRKPVAETSPGRWQYRCSCGRRYPFPDAIMDCRDIPGILPEREWLCGSCFKDLERAEQAITSTEDDPPSRKEFRARFAEKSGASPAEAARIRAKEIPERRGPKGRSRRIQ